MNHLGEIISLLVAVSWTATALFADEASHRLGAMTVNVIRLVISAVILALVLWCTVGAPYPVYADGATWHWLGLSALVGYIFGDFCLFNSYVIIGARLGQLFMTLAPPAAAVTGMLLLGETMSWKAVLAMVVTLSGIAISILSRTDGKHVRLNLPLKGILLGIGAGVGQGVGLVLSKIGLQHYEAALPADTPALMGEMLPVASTMIRSVVGGIGFLAIMALMKDLPKLKAAFQNREGMKYALLTTLFGPVIGVSLSLMAVRSANAGIASTLMALTPVLIIIPYVFIYKRKVSGKEILGACLSMTGVALFFLLN